MIVEALLAVTLVSAFAVFLAPDKIAGKLAFVLSLLPAAGSIWMYSDFNGSGNALLGGKLAFEETFKWVTFGPYALNWHVGLDGISMPLLVLTAVLTPLAILAAWTPIQSRQSQFFGLMLFMEMSLLGVFSALDFFIWFIFWEMVLVPMYFLIGIWGGPRRKYAAIKFFVYTNVASLLMFIGFIALVFGLGDSITSLDMPVIAQALNDGQLGSLGGIGAGTLKALAFFAMFIGFGVKVPIVPFHTWLPDAHVEAPTPVSIMLAGVMLKMGTYALLRFNFTMLPGVAKDYAFIIALVAVVSVIYGALLALAQSDLKRIVAYSSVSSMGYVILGLVAFNMYGVGGATFQMVAHGLISGLMFMAVGVIYNTTHTRMVSDMSGLADKMPITVAVFVAGAFGYMGLPLMAGFAAEFFIFVGAFHSTVLAGTVAGTNGLALFTGAAMFGIVIVAGYLLFAMQRTLFGPFRLETDYEVGRASFHDVAPLVVLILLVILLGVQPNIFYHMIQDAVGEMALLAGGGA
ncbi:NADH dehydrogenase-like complex subunit M [Haladaptatus paucihalophilus DX253]|uniref:NADH dehydrogenase subunit M n=1 Tax=Haladaptatus paucihalophilus DX253 TaxID=797209 RepID=E7QRF7_HALPU|nr:NuoM family protein [Haladaptatus paucihalophilus]EFW92576.1 NADH dehydrogenase-like complex subunit M [Haladaptatus paucihalophilus DX253]SHK18725.1 NADH dehydrogenase subunit M [Haladaptatus paucihalophilus DX253]